MTVKWKSTVAFLLALCMVAGPLSSCKSKKAPADTTTGSTDTLGATTEKVPETTAPSVDPSEPDALYAGPHADLILNAHELANDSHIHFENQTTAFIKNQNAQIKYPMAAQGNQSVTYANANGAAYVTDTMDVFLEMNNGKRFYASKSFTPSYCNTYRFGYYYYENRFEGQRFVGEEMILDTKEIDLSAASAWNDCRRPEKTDDGLRVKLSSNRDPWMAFDTDFSADQFDYLYITMRTDAKDAEKDYSEIFVQTEGMEDFSESLSYKFNVTADGTYQTYIIPASELSTYKGRVTRVRVDFRGQRSDIFEIQSIKAVKLDTEGAPMRATLQRTFAAYSDKMHQIFQLATDQKIEHVAKFGLLTEIPADTVSQLIIKDQKGLHEGLSGIDWETVEYVGFDIKNVGVFGYILPIEKGGRLEIALKDGTYVIQQYMTPKRHMLLPCRQGMLNTGDQFFGNRVYTDMTHTFDAFLKEAEFERHPLTGDQFTVHQEENQAEASFGGYDALRGTYIVKISGPSGFNTPYYQSPNNHYTAKFTVNSPDDRRFYVVAATECGCLESAVLLNQSRMMLPLPIEVCKNFNGDGENTIYNLDDAAYGEAIIPMTVKAHQEETYTMVHLYQNFGNFPLKQISSIQYFKPYYHLSTGVTETNCLVPFDQGGPMLPDHRPMSAPLWSNQPQHTNGGFHYFLRYTDSHKHFHTTDNISQSVGHYGPTYADVTLNNRTDNGAIDVSYTHMEMPQTDENRAYYEMRYTVNQDISITDFAHDFAFYSMTDNDPTGLYQQIGYLNEQNQCSVAPNNLTEGREVDYVLGSQCPYFSMFNMKDYENAGGHGYVNLSFMIFDSQFTINGESVTPSFVLVNSYNTLRLSLNLGEVNLKAGDTFTIRAIIMPWGSQLSDYSTEAPDRNVRDVRENTLLHPLTPKAEADCTVMDSAFVPKFRTTNGTSAEFTLSGGCNNAAVRIYGFNKLTAPAIFEKVNGEWVPYAVSSLESPDACGYAHTYDGYSVVYDGDGTFSYSFVVDMGKNGEARTFRMVADQDFSSWPMDDPVPDPEDKNDLNIYFGSREVQNLFQGCGEIGGTKLGNGHEYVRIFGNSVAPEAYMEMFKNTEEIATGQYIVLKFRAPKGTDARCTTFEFFLSTASDEAAEGDSVRISLPSLADNEWHVVVIDVAAAKEHHNFKPNENGQYIPKYFRFDIFNFITEPGDYVDVAYVGMTDSPDKIFGMSQDMSEVLMVHDLDQIIRYDPHTGKEFGA